MRLEREMEVIEGEAVARQLHRHREWTRIDVNLDCGCLVAPKRSEAGLVSRFALNFRKWLIFSLDLRKSLIFNPRLTQVVDFHDFFRYF
jgi:hypothetical protein